MPSRPGYPGEPHVEPLSFSRRGFFARASTAALAAFAVVAGAPELARADPADGAVTGVAHPPSGLPVGAAAPVVEGERVGGGRWSSTEWAGRTHLVAFADPGCLACDDLVPGLVAGVVAPTVVIGEAAAGSWPAEWRPPAGAEDRVVVLDDAVGVMAAAFGSGFTPHVFVIDEGGAVTAQGPADSLDAVRTLLRESEGIRIVRPGVGGA